MKKGGLFGSQRYIGRVILPVILTLGGPAVNCYCPGDCGSPASEADAACRGSIIALGAGLANKTTGEQEAFFAQNALLVAYNCAYAEKLEE